MRENTDKAIALDRLRFQRFGDAMFVFAIWVWMTVSVGPWWVGVLILFAGSLLNAIESRRPHAALLAALTGEGKDAVQR